ncbi:metalloregulator ArsR/SmtB family transcription factor [Mollicutes bacterium LVI A0078]|nr:metalloregulator ArsR/SmtB family transcription factor [Mollicutes bacterium LVI A0075]WOO91341.1 metalloregulator ArsR/SmtB family transcription factor [Mollicutes bacterium LVI A0078]
MTNKLAEFFSLFSDGTRIKILTQLLDGEATVSSIAANCELTISNTSHQLRLLKDQKLVKARKEGKYNYYSLDDDHVRVIIEYGIEHLSEK